MSKQRTKHIKVYFDPHATNKNVSYYAWHPATDNYSWQASAQEARSVVQQRVDGERATLQAGRAAYRARLTKMI